MPRFRARPLRGSAALEVEPPDGAERFLVIADVHLGLGAQAGWADGPAEGSAAALAEEAVRIAREARSDRLIIAGDVKHPIVGTPAGLRPLVFRFFADLLGAGLAVEVVQGNHDPGIGPYLPREVVLHPPDGLVRGGLGIFHGHRWPSPEVLAAPHLVAGHLHPGFRFAPSAHAAISKRRCWVRTTFPPYVAPGKRRAIDRRFVARDLVVLPPFNPLAGTEALNRSRPSRGRSFLFSRFLVHGESRLYLLDGTDLGRLTGPRGPPERPAPDVARRDR
ncbi:MAG TPA: metallophosphoesterase [Thermoplasmata archaeon]|nr:metallophosphoesterase [Thermoplasmata archaeon]